MIVKFIGKRIENKIILNDFLKKEKKLKDYDTFFIIFCLKNNKLFKLSNSNWVKILILLNLILYIYKIYIFFNKIWISNI